MHRVSKVDGLDYVVVLDGLGLSSWCLPDEVVSDPGIQASGDSLLSLDGTGRLALVWSASDRRSHLVTVDTLEQEERYDWNTLQPAFLDASGEGLLQVWELGKPAEVARCDLRGTEVERRPLPFPVLAKTTLATGLFAPSWSRAVLAGEAGRVAVVDDVGRLLMVDLRDFQAPKVVASAMLGAPPSWDVQLTPFEDALGVIAHDSVKGTATVWVASGRDVLKKKGLAALTMPAFVSKDAVLTQESDGVLARVSLRDGARRVLRLPEVGRETQLDPRGAGRPVAGGGLTAFLPWHGESLITFDGETGEPSEVSRLLPEDGREVRRFILERVRLANEAARVTGRRFELHGLHFKPKQKSYSLTVSAQGGDGSLWSHAVTGWLHGLYGDLSARAPGGWRPARFHGVDLPKTPPPVTDAGELAAMLGRMDDYGIRLSNLVAVIDHFYERGLPTWVADPRSKPILTDGAGVLLLQAFFAGFTSEGPVKLAPGVERWRKAPESATVLAARVPHLSASHASLESRLIVPLAQLAAVHLKAEAAPLLLALARQAHPEHLRYGKGPVVEAVRWWARGYEAVAKPLAERIEDRELRVALDPAAGRF